MFRLSGLPQIDAVEEKRRVRESVKTNIFSFILLCSAIRLGEFQSFFMVSLQFFFEIVAASRSNNDTLEAKIFMFCHLLLNELNTKIKTFSLFVSSPHRPIKNRSAEIVNWCWCPMRRKSAVKNKDLREHPIPICSTNKTTITQMLKVTFHELIYKRIITN